MLLVVVLLVAAIASAISLALVIMIVNSSIFVIVAIIIAIVLVIIVLASVSTIVLIGMFLRGFLLRRRLRLLPLVSLASLALLLWMAKTQSNSLSVFGSCSFSFECILFSQYLGSLRVGFRLYVQGFDT